MPDIQAAPVATFRDDRFSHTVLDDPGFAASNRRPAPTRVIEVGAATVGIAVPEARGVRFFSSSRAFDRLDGLVFRSIEQAARAARALAQSAPQRSERRLRPG